MTITETLDMAIKYSETGTMDGYYEVGSVGNRYNTYMTNSEWDAFLNGMDAVAKKEYGNGSGGELCEKNHRPPKMASYGSSSRMIYNLSHTNKDFHFEKQLPTKIGGKANLDGFLDDGDRYVFVEAKCHEPYSSHKSNSVSVAYNEFYEYINVTELDIAMTPSACGRYMNVVYSVNGRTISHFDLKQMICHLLGIANGILTGELDKKKIDFIYLLYNPKSLEMSKEDMIKIFRIYESTLYECSIIDFKSLFYRALEFLNERKHDKQLSDYEIADIVNGFSFTTASQKPDSYPKMIKA